MNNSALVYVLTRLEIDSSGNVTSRNVGVTFSLFDAEEYAARSYENGFERHSVSAEWHDDVETSATVSVMRNFRALVEEMQMNALR